MSGELYGALIAAQAEFPAIPKTRRAEVPTKNGGKFTYKYAGLSDVLESCRPILVKHGLTTFDRLENGDGHKLVVVLAHKSGAFIESSASIPLDLGDPQKVGSWLTYMRRYLMCGLLGVAPDEDVDGIGASEAPRSRNWTHPKTTPPKQASDAPELKTSDGEVINVWPSEFAQAWQTLVNSCGDEQALKDLALANGCTKVADISAEFGSNAAEMWRKRWEELRAHAQAT